MIYDGKVCGLNLAAVVAPKETEGDDTDPGFLVTNLRKPETAIQRYAERFHIEEWFKDFKHQLGIAGCRQEILCESDVSFWYLLLLTVYVCWLATLPADYITYKTH